jgi:tripartite-type tricarboxylate transporter receptor subunit TctC
MRYMEGIARCFSLLIFCSGAVAQAYPVKPLRLVIGFPPGGAVDVVARTLAGGMHDTLGQPVIVDNRPGANGVIGTEVVAKAIPDGYTLGLVSISTLVLNVHLYPGISYHTIRDFSHIGAVGEVASLIGTHPAVPVRSMKTLVALARSRPGQLTFASSGVGSLQHLAIEIFNTTQHARLTHVPYKGAAQALTDVMGGHIDGLVVSLPSALAAARSGKLVALAVTSDRRTPALSEVPTAKEQGLPELVVANWYGLVGPPNLAPHIVSALHAAILKGLASAAAKERFAAAGIEPKTDASPAAFSRFVGDEFGRWERIVKNSGVKVD